MKVAAVCLTFSLAFLHCGDNLSGPVDNLLAATDRYTYSSGQSIVITISTFGHKTVVIQHCCSYPMYRADVEVDGGWQEIVDRSSCDSTCDTRYFFTQGPNSHFDTLGGGFTGGSRTFRLRIPYADTVGGPPAGEITTNSFRVF